MHSRDPLGSPVNELVPAVTVLICFEFWGKGGPKRLAVDLDPWAEWVQCEQDEKGSSTGLYKAGQWLLVIVRVVAPTTVGVARGSSEPRVAVRND